MNIIQLKKTTRAIVLAVGILAVVLPTFITGVTTQSESSWIDSYDKKPCDKDRGYDKSNYKEKSNININKINCNSVNYNVIDNVNGNNNIGNDNREKGTAN